MRISEHKNIFAKFYTQILNWSEEVFVVKEVKNTVLRTYVFRDLSIEEIVGMFYGKDLQKSKEFRVEKVINKNGDGLYPKGKCYDNCFNSWIES